ncbi:hypothetical protein M885DRAFT_505171 [Pelagophyceae sp. CCMP2097]|nr:hypothetical protein M885DRAFT_505171 [Pelagophyceae sp. CCMP2097]
MVTTTSSKMMTTATSSFSSPYSLSSSDQSRMIRSVTVPLESGAPSAVYPRRARWRRVTSGGEASRWRFDLAAPLRTAPAPGATSAAQGCTASIGGGCGPSCTVIASGAWCTVIGGGFTVIGGGCILAGVRLCFGRGPSCTVIGTSPCTAVGGGIRASVHGAVPGAAAPQKAESKKPKAKSRAAKSQKRPGQVDFRRAHVVQQPEARLDRKGDVQAKQLLRLLLHEEC